MSMVNGRFVLPLSAIHQAAALIDSSGHRVIPNSSLKGKERQCISCGRLWPWTVFDVEVVHQTSHVCTRCARPDLDVQRWVRLYDEMKSHVLEARKKLIKRRDGAVQSESITPSRSTSIPATSNSSSHVHAAPSVGPGNGTATGSLVADKSVGRGPGQIRLLDDGVFEGLKRTFKPKDWEDIREPDRATMWLQMNFCPAASSHSIRQVDVFNSYMRLIDSLPRRGSATKRLNPALDGVELIKLCLNIWGNTGVEMQGAPKYTLSGLQARSNSAIHHTSVSESGQPNRPSSSKTATAGPRTGPGTQSPLQAAMGQTIETAGSTPSQLKLDAIVGPNLERALPTPIAEAQAGTKPRQGIPMWSTSQAHMPAHTHKGKERAVETEDSGVQKGLTKKRRRSIGVPEGVEVIVIDEDDGDIIDDGDEWGILRPKKRARKSAMTQRQLSTSTMRTGSLTVQAKPKPKPNHGSYPSSRALSVIGSDINCLDQPIQDDMEMEEDDPIIVGDSDTEPQPAVKATAEEEIDELDEDDDPIDLADLQNISKLGHRIAWGENTAEEHNARAHKVQLTDQVEVAAERDGEARNERETSIGSEAEVGDLLL
ncbi:hypothetical protein IAT40_002158 [Kwoniella sp. CBS 6097]